MEASPGKRHRTRSVIDSMSWQTTTILLERLRAFDDRAWDDFSARFAEPIARFARKFGVDEATAQDIAQETLTAAATGVREGRFERGRGKLSSWLFGIAWRETMRRRRDDRFERQAPAPAESGRTTFFSALPDERTARHAWDDDWHRFVLDRCISQARLEFTEQTFTLFEEVALRNVSPSLVAERHGVSRNSVFIAKHRVLKRLGELRVSIADGDVA